MKAHINRWEGVGPYWLHTILIFGFLFVCTKLAGIIAIVSWVIFVLFGLMFLMKTFMVINRISAPWKGLFNPIMIIYARAAASVQVRHGLPVDRNLASIILVKSIYPELTDKEAKAFVEDAFNCMVDFTDKQAVKEEMIKSKSFNQDKLDGFLNDVHEKLRQGAIRNESSIPQWTAAKIVEKEKGKNEKIRLLVALLTGRVK